MADKLTPKQEAFAFAVGYEKLSYKEAYIKAYNAEKMAVNTIYRKAHSLANNGKIRARIDHYVLEQQREARLAVDWDYKKQFDEYRFVLIKNKKDILKADKNGQAAKHANNTAILGALAGIESLLDKVIPVELEETETEFEDDGLIEALSNIPKGLWEDEKD
ncbi:hypothetical protein ET006_05395 [Lactococcus garvieae]|nr:hypothetical protein [Lactococcus garvieae]UKS68434.1 hypothetical protein G8766_04280 [Lactococcus garvieae]